MMRDFNTRSRDAYSKKADGYDTSREEIYTATFANLEKLHTTKHGVLRIRQNLGLTDDDVVAWCKEKTILADKIIRKGKNWYVYVDDAVITINAHSYTIITAHKQKARKQNDNTPRTPR